MIIVIVFRLKTFSSAGFNTNPTLLQGEFIVWTQTELNYSLISATDRNAISHDQTVVDTRHLVGTSTDHRTKTNTGHVGKKGIISKPLDSHGGQEDSRRTSIGSNDSQRMIIRKDITWTVE